MNLLKCAFRVSSWKFLGFMVNKRGIKANPEKIQALIDMRSPVSVKEVQNLTGKVVDLSHFVSKEIDRCLPFFDILLRAKKFTWSIKCEKDFQNLKEHLRKLLLLSKLLASEDIFFYDLDVSEHTVSSDSFEKRIGCNYSFIM